MQKNEAEVFSNKRSNFYDTTFGRFLIRTIAFRPYAVGQRYLRQLNFTWDELAGKRVLDMGACTAGFAKEARNHGVKVVSMDKDFSPLQTFARGRKVERGVPYARADMFKLPFRSGSFDTIVSNAVIHWAIEHPWQMQVMLREAKRVVRRGGELRFSTGGSGNLLNWLVNYNPNVRSKVFRKAEEIDQAVLHDMPWAESSLPFLAMTDAISRYAPQVKVQALINGRNGQYDRVSWSIKY